MREKRELNLSADEALPADLQISHAKLTASKARKTEVASFRLSVEAHAALMARAAEAGLSSRAWLEQAILENKTQIVAAPKLHPELKPLLFQANKAGNNINQLAHHFNLMHLRGNLSEATCKEGLYKLASIQTLMREAVAHARSN